MKKVFNFVRIVAFILLVAVLLGYWNEVFKFKDQNGMVGMDIFYRQPEDSVDMLIVGSSHAFTNINTGTLWDEYGIASYLLGANLQPMNNSYHYIKEAIRYQNPKVIVLEGYVLTEGSDYLTQEFIINNTYGLHFSENSMEAMNDTIPPDADLMEYGLYYGRYHTRYNELSSVDFNYGITEEDYYNCFKGFHSLIGANPATEPHFNRRRDNTMSLSIRVEYYYRRICQLCQDNNIELVVAVAPYADYCNEHRMKYNEARSIASEYDFELIDYNEYYNQMDLDFENDFYNPGHLNVVGSRKFTTYLGSYLDFAYDLPDRSTDDSGMFDTWEMNARYLEMDYNDHLVRTTIVAEDYFSVLRELPEEYIVIIYLTNPRNIYQETKRYLGYYDIPCVRFDNQHIWMIHDGIVTRYEQNDDGLYFERVYGDHHLVANRDGVYYDGTLIYHGNTGADITVVNELYGAVVESVTFDNDLKW